MAAKGMVRTGLLYAILAFVGFPAQAAEPLVSIELNKLEVHGEACRAYLVLENKAGTAFESLKLDLVTFNAEGVVAKRLAVETAPLAAGKTSITVFDIAGQKCRGINRVLLNSILACRQAGAPRTDCLERVVTSARGRVPFIK
jgi:hypothetical protein